MPTCADKVSITTAAIHELELVRDAAARFAPMHVAIDARVSGPDQHLHELFTHGGRKPTGIEAVVREEVKMVPQMASSC